MKIYNAKVFLRKEFVRGGVEFDTKIRSAGADITDGEIDAQGGYLIPGLIDIHTHGAVGVDVSDGVPDGLTKLGEYYAASGVTSWCPTTMTLKKDELLVAIRSIGKYQRTPAGAKMAGIHLEGPFISYEKRGAHKAENITNPDLDLFASLVSASGNNIAKMTIAPELPGAIPMMQEMIRHCAISLGHTNADYETARQAFWAGATQVTHLFNAMPPMLHRAPGVIVAAMEEGASAEIICDGLHVHPSMVRLAFSMFGWETVLISDSLRCAGMPDGEYELGGQQIVLKDHVAKLKDQDTLAGSVIHLMDAVRYAHQVVHLPLVRAVYAATKAPARAIRRDDIGQIAPGKCADLVLLDEDLNVKAVWIDGVRVPAEN
ncbi:MAG: N-acetylglucosamine-6-phosphate deacetylase [Lachnospiraceae bacterium]|nr:N-acetylglucosamine-6-phosphate deacetylase [Lachnospiraceae bacterium]